MAKKKRSDEKVREILEEARARFTRCVAWESNCRVRQIEDLKFNEGDSDNLYQWPEEVRSRMSDETKPMLTINKTRQHVLDILNDARQSRVAIKVRATGDGASFESAEVYNGVIRHIEYISNAASAYQHALAFATKCGIGYWRVVTGYSNDDSFDQEVFIRRIPDPMTVYLDPDIVEFDGSDAKFGFVFTSKSTAEWKLDNPGKDVPAAHPALDGGSPFVTGDRIITCEYWRRLEVADELLAFEDKDPQTGQPMTLVVKKSEMPAELVEVIKNLDGFKSRKIKTHRVEWFKFEGDDIVDEGDWLGAYIPIVRCVGEETVIDGELDRKGHVRALKDPQRMFNYNAAGSIEFGALQSKSPWVTPADAIEGYETLWDNANIENLAYLPYNHMDDEGEKIPPPQRQMPPTSAPVFMQGMMDAAEWMRMVSGQYQSDMGAPSNERSGVAIAQRQRQGDNATFHYLDHQASAIRFTGKILIDLIPKVYDTPRLLKMQGDEGDETEVKVDPAQKEALAKMEMARGKVETIFNPSVGKYDVVADVGPAFATKRQEAFNAYTQLLSQNSELTSVIGDLMLRAADFPGADEAAQRLKRMVPAQALQDGPTPDMQQAQQQIQALEQLIKELGTKLADKEASHLNDQQQNAIKAYDSQTKRVAAIKDYLAADPEGLLRLVMQVMAEAESTSAEGLAPALEPTQELTAENMAPPAQPMMGGPPQGDPMMGGAPMMPENPNPDDMGSEAPMGGPAEMSPV